MIFINIFTYRLLYFIFAPFILFFGLFLSRKMRRFLLRRESTLKKQNQKTFWVHVSSGEFEHAKPLLRKLKEEESNTKIVVTYSSPSYLKAIKNCKEVDFYTPFVLDLRAPVSHLIRTINPKIVLISRTDLWPELLDQLKAKKIPSMVFARHENGSGLLTKKFSYPLTYQKLSHISFVAESDYKSYINIATPNSHSIDGDPRVEEVFHKQRLVDINESEIFKDSLILGSTWPEDIKIIKGPLKDLLQADKLKKLIIAPHETEPHIIEDLIQTFKEFEPRLFSNDNDLNSKVIVVDKIGHLFGLYPRCEIAFVGGSYKKKVHSVLEPLSFGLPVLVGPKHLNSYEAKSCLKKGYVINCETSNEFKSSLEDLLNSRPPRLEITNQVKNTKVPSQLVWEQIDQLVQLSQQKSL